MMMKASVKCLAGVDQPFRNDPGKIKSTAAKRKPSFGLSVMRGAVPTETTTETHLPSFKPQVFSCFLLDGVLAPPR